MKRTLVLGASLNSARYANLVTHRLLKEEHEVFAIGNKRGTIGTVSVGTDKIFIPDIDTITLYLNAIRQKEYYDYIIELNPKRVIFNPGTENHEFFKLLKKHRINYQLACTLVLLSTNQY